MLLYPDRCDTGAHLRMHTSSHATRLYAPERRGSDSFCISSNCPGLAHSRGPIKAHGKQVSQSSQVSSSNLSNSSPLTPTHNTHSHSRGGLIPNRGPKWYQHHNSLQQLQPQTLCDPMDDSPLGCCVPGILQARILEWLAIPFSRGSSQPRD